MATYTSNYGWTKPSGSDNVDISVLNNNLDGQDGVIHDAFLNMAPPFSESSTYAVDDIVLYTTGLYKCHTPVITPGSWTGSTNWQVYKLSEGGSGGGGTSNYNQLTNKPQINSIELSGNKTASDLGLQDELTFDNTPTDGSNNPVKSDGIYDSEKDIYAVMGQMGAKNLLPYPYSETTKTVNGVTFTDNGDGTVTVSTVAGGASAAVQLVMQTRASDKIHLKAGNYKLSGCPSGGSATTYILQASNTAVSPQISVIDSGSGADIQMGQEASLGVWINIAKNAVITTPITFKPMLRLASDTDDTYQPYAKTNKELTESYPADRVMMSDGVTSVEDAVMSEPTTAQKIADYVGDNLLSVLKIGHMVNVSGRFQVTTQKPAGQNYNLFENLPIPAGTIVPLANTSNVLLIINGGGYITSNDAIAPGYYNVQCTYAEHIN